ncbi:PKD domain-containing protein [Pedobacter frigidisoli]|uniref:PKD domain-containing protein n=1 Tax=Pedobacter frigidisoli TaxID=2530455 RepID=UPI00293184D1|nr:PKD domain-containing protein [Pedobacter frigidisoli]
MKINFPGILILSTMLLISCKKEVSEVKEEENPVVHSSPYINKIYEFKQAPGQFTNDLVKTDILIGSAGNGLVSLGAYGGFIVFGFDHPVENGSGADLGIYGNPLIASGMEFSEPGIVCVMKDENKNGLPDDTWYELAGSEYNASTTIKGYSITYHKPATLSDDIRWTDNQGKEGLVLRNQFHSQDYFPSWATNSTISFTGTLVKNTLVAGAIISNKPLAYGYTDNGSSEYLALQEKLGRGYNTFDIDWAVDASGKRVTLNAVDFVKVYTAQNNNGNPFHPDLSNERSRYIGEISTEFGGAADLKLLK